MVRGFLLNLELYNAHADTEFIIRSATFPRGSKIIMEIASGTSSITPTEVFFLFLFLKQFYIITGLTLNRKLLIWLLDPFPE